MTEGRFLSDIEDEIERLIRKRGSMTVSEICGAMPDDDFIIVGAVDRMIRDKRLRLDAAEKDSKKLTVGSTTKPAGGSDE